MIFVLEIFRPMEVDKKCLKILIEIAALIFKKLKHRSELIEDLFIIRD